MTMTSELGSTGEREGVLQNAIDWNHPAAAHAVILDAEKSIIDWRGRTKIAICGFAASSTQLAPFDDPEWIICGINQLYRHIRRADAWFDIHSYWDEKEAMVEGTDHVKWCAEAPIPIVLIERDPRVPNAVRYPIERMTGKAPDSPPWATDYFTSTISFMIAWAIDQGFKTIGLWGIDLIVGQEYFWQKACAEWWLGVANGLGIEIRLPHETALLKQAYRYGYEREPDYRPIKLSNMEHRLKAYRDEHQEALKKMYLLDGGVQALEKALLELDEAAIAKQVEAMQAERQATLKRLYTLDGAIQDASYWQEWMNLHMRGGTVRES